MKPKNWNGLKLMFLGAVIGLVGWSIHEAAYDFGHGTGVMGALVCLSGFIVQLNPPSSALS